MPEKSSPIGILLSVLGIGMLLVQAVPIQISSGGTTARTMPVVQRNLRTQADELVQSSNNSSVGSDGAYSPNSNSTSNLSAENQSLTYANVPGQNFSLPVDTNLSNYSKGAPLASGPNTGHWWVGAYYYGQSFTGTTTSVEIATPNDVPTPGDYGYFGLLSVYDSAGAYDQFGIMGNYLPQAGYASSKTDTWQVTWAGIPWTIGGQTYCGTWGRIITDYNIDQFTLSPATWYNFTMTIDSGTVTYTVYENLGGPHGYQYPVWKFTHVTGGQYFQFATSLTCNGFGSYVKDYTDYEEYYYVNQQAAPNWDQFFVSNMAAGNLIGPSSFVCYWCAYVNGTNPPNSLVEHPPFDVFIFNEPIFFNLSRYWIVGSPGGTVQINGNAGNAFTGSNCAPVCTINSIAATYVSPSGYGLQVSVAPSSGVTPFNFIVTVQIPQSAPCVSFAVGLKATDTYSSAFTTLQFHVNVASCGPGGGGGGSGGGSGGCVAADTVVDTPNGYSTVQSLHHGETIYGYNLTNQDLVDETVNAITTNSSGTFVDINQGRLYATVLDQPLYIMNSSFTGWLRNPQNLSTGEFLWDAFNSSWLPISNITYLYKILSVYDVSASTGTNDFIAGGVLAMSKYNGGGGI